MSMFLRQLQHVIDQIPGSIGIKTVDSVYMAGNQFFARIMGLPHPEDFSGRCDKDFELTSQLADEYVSQDKYVIEHEATFKSFQFRRCADKPFRLFYSFKQPFYNESNEIIGMIGHGTCLDDTFIYSLTRLLNIAHNSLTEQNFRLVDTFNCDQVVLTNRESEILFYLMHGKTAKGIAAILHISNRTVETYLSKLKEKFKCHSKTQLIELSMQRGLYQMIPMSIISEWLN